MELKIEKEFFSKNNTLLVSLTLAFICLALSIFFPAANSIQGITKNIFFLVIIPVLYIKFILKKDLSSFGFNLKNPRLGAFWMMAGFLLSLGVAYALFRYTAFGKFYQINSLISGNFKLFLLYELVMMNIFLFTYDFFFKGFLLFSLEPKFGWWSVPIQALVQILAIYFVGSLGWSFVPHLIHSCFGGAVSKKTHSFIWAYLAGLIFIFIFDALVIRASVLSSGLL